jgi:phosphoribosyl-ATP pyrophosphohydrolase/phosphoribosyl-AMP cyclohydrolase
MFVSKDIVGQVKFDDRGLVPIIIQDAYSGIVLSLMYANQDALDKMYETEFVWRFSRSKNKLMKKGEESGFVQEIISIIPDCDSDALLIKVKPNGPACHNGTVSCFWSGASQLGEKTTNNKNSQFDSANKQSSQPGTNKTQNPQLETTRLAVLSELAATISDRKQNPKPDSYTSSIVNDKKQIMEKLNEEFEELLAAEKEDEIVWEAADLVYFLLVYLENRRVKFSKVLEELEKRRK